LIACEQTHWSLSLDAGDLPTALMIQAVGVDGTPIAVEACLLAGWHRDRPVGRRWRRRRLHRGWATYGPGSR
jgi:hypothetical protein